MMGASAWTTPFGETALTFPYREALVDDLKLSIPARFRRWDPDEKRWLIMGAYREQAIALLLEHFPRAEVPGDVPRRMPSTPARTVRPRPPIPFPVAPDADDQPDPAPLVASIRCPKCHQRHDQPIRVVTASSSTVAKQERPPAEFVAICPACSCLLVVSFVPTTAVLQDAS